MAGKSFIALAAALSLVPLVAAHGAITKVETSSGKSTTALSRYNPNAKGDSAIRIMLKDIEPNAFVTPDNWGNNAKMSCPDAGNRPASSHLQVAAGETLSIFWEGATGEIDHKPGVGSFVGQHAWVHATGPILNYLADCKGDCTKFDPTNAGWTKISADGVNMNAEISSDLRRTMAGKPEPYYPAEGKKGLWASAKLIQDGSVWRVPIPAQLKPGKYMLRHEISAMHSPKKNQNYIGCIQLDVTGSGSATLPGGTQAKDLYSPSSQFGTFNIYTDDHAKFTTPGPALWKPSGEGNTTPEPAPVPEPSKPSSTKPETPASTPATPVQSEPAEPSTTRKCKPRKRALPSPAVAKRHRRRLSAEH